MFVFDMIFGYYVFFDFLDVLDFWRQIWLGGEAVAKPLAPASRNKALGSVCSLYYDTCLGMYTFEQWPPCQEVEISVCVCMFLGLSKFSVLHPLYVKQNSRE